MRVTKRVLCLCVSLALTAALPFQTGSVWAADNAKGVSPSIGEAVSIEDDLTDDDVLDEGNEEKVAANGYGEELADADDEVSLFAISEGPALSSATSGSCGDSAKWSLSDGVLTISGSGAMKDYSASSSPAPWLDSSSEITSIVVEKGITSIGKQAFAKLVNVTSVSLPSTVTTLGEGAFYGCSSLAGITLPSNVTALPSGVFAECYSLASINLTNITSMADYALQQTSIKTLTIPKGLTSLSYLAFFGAGITAFKVADGNSAYMAKNGVLYSKDGKTLLAYPAEATATSFTVSSGVKKIGDGAFLKNAYLTSLNLGSVTELGESACQEMKSLEKSSIPDSVTEVGYFTFYGCESLTSVKFGKGLTETSYEMFRDCSALANIDFGSSLTTIGPTSFGECTSLTSVTLPANIKKIDVAAFGLCSNLVSFTSKSITNVPFKAFWYCTSLKNVKLNKGVTTIYRCAFYGCSSLSKITLPSSVSFVHSIAFPESTVITCEDVSMRPFGKNGYRHLDDIAVTGTANYTKAFKVLELVNKERTAKGLSKLYMDESLLDAAMQRAAEQSVLFAHTRPDGSSCFQAESTMFAENVAYGQSTASEVMNSWMNSAGHKANILNDSATTIGIGCFIQNGVTYWVQCFGNGDAGKNCSQPEDASMQAWMTIATESFNEAEESTGTIFGSAETYEYTVSLDLQASSIRVGGKTQAVMKITNGSQSSLETEIDSDSVTWSSSAAKIASVSSTGKVKGLADGKAAIQGSLGHYKASADIKVGIVLSTPNTKMTSTTKGVKVEWTKVSKANGYIIYRKVNGGSWKRLAVIPKMGTTAYTDTTVKSGKTYTYKVKAYMKKTNGKKAYSATKSSKTKMYLASPKFAAKVKSIGIKLTWKKTAGAKKYVIYRKTGNGKYTKLVSIKKASTVAYVDKTAKKGKKYTYKIKSVNGNTYSAAKTSKTVKR